MIEDIIFREIGKGIYKLKKVTVSPNQNVFGLIEIEGNIYEKEFLPDPAFNWAGTKQGKEVLQAGLQRATF